MAVFAYVMLLHATIGGLLFWSAPTGRGSSGGAQLSLDRTRHQLVTPAPPAPSAPAPRRRAAASGAAAVTAAAPELELLIPPHGTIARRLINAWLSEEAS